ncbi:unnamed protein product [Calicophoron daubneyi]|uniref:BACK domain-containing protein n=1 Tax=Calicophoron daubneyi TaxID=300641 RepID=A0AAV2TMW1_CALDB
MRRPTSDVRQRESRRSSLDNAGSRRRNSSVPFHNARSERNPNSLDSDTDFLCDRAVEFMESGDIHSIVAVELAEQSMYFERLLRYHKGRGYIRLPEFLNSGFTSVLEYIRKGKTDINPENVYHIFIAADYLLVPKLKQECANLLKEVANDPSTAISLWLNCRTLYWPEVGTMAFEKILENFESVWPTADFQQLEAADVWSILREDGLNCKREKSVFEAIQSWINLSPKNRLQYALDMLLCIRIGMLSPSNLEMIKNTELVKTIPEYAAIIQDWPKCLVQKDNPIIAACGRQFITPRLPHEVVMVFGGWCDGEGPRAAAQVYNPRANSWTLWTEAGPQAQPPANDWIELANEAVATAAQSDVTTPDGGGTAQPPQPGALQKAIEVASALTAYRNTLTPDGVDAEQVDRHDSTMLENTGSLIGEIPRRVYAGCVLIGTRVYLVGGFDGTNALKSTLCYDFEIDSGWYEISCMYEKRYYVSVAYASNHIYALGGHNGENQGRLDTAERYTLEENLWQTIASMNRVRSDAAAAELGGRVYVAGGFEGRRYHDSAEYYEPDSNQWTLISRMHSPRGGISLAQQGGYLYAIGGNDGNSRLRTIERYDMQEGKWELVGQMNRRKSNLSSTVVNDDIYILGGWSDEPEAGILDLVERFDTTTRECHIVRPLTFPASATCACTLTDKNLVKKYIRPLPASTTHESGPSFGLFYSQTPRQEVTPNVNQSSASLSPTHDSTYATPSIIGQRNTNSQLSPVAGVSRTPGLSSELNSNRNPTVTGRADDKRTATGSTQVRTKRLATDEDFSYPDKAERQNQYEDEDSLSHGPIVRARKSSRGENTYPDGQNAISRSLRSPWRSSTKRDVSRAE